MKLTTARLKKLIREELSKVNEAYYRAVRDLSPDEIAQMNKIMPMFDVYEKGVNEETARLASELAVQFGLADAVEESLFTMLADMKKKRPKGRNMFQHDEDKYKLEKFISILQQVVMDNVENMPPGTYPEDGEPLDV